MRGRFTSLRTNIENVRNVLVFLGILEEYKDLIIFEWNFKDLLIEKYTSLLHQ
jgi:uncharacterized protein YkvS